MYTTLETAPVGGGDATAALQAAYRARLASRAQASALALAIGAIVVYPAWSVFDHALEEPALAAGFTATRLATTAILLGLLLIMWRTSAGQRWPVPLVTIILSAIQLTVGWMLPQVQHLELYLLGATLVLYASGAILAASPWWTLLLFAATAAGTAVGVVTTGRALPADELLAAGVYLGSAAALSTIGHALRWTSMSAEIRWRCALEAEQATTQQLVTELRTLSVRDPLTGLANRRRWDDELAAACARTADDGSSLSVLLIDVDHFKTINDTAGHATGDAVLVRIAALLHGSIRDHDLAARLGGDELALLLTATGHTGAIDLAERIRRQIHLLTFTGLHLTVTVSIGVATAHGMDADPTRLLHTADSNLYRAKTTRNTITSTTPATTSVDCVSTPTGTPAARNDVHARRLTDPTGSPAVLTAPGTPA